MRIALFGGSFDPPHVAHVLGAAYVLSTTDVDRVLAVPVFAHAFGKPLAPFEHRTKMTELAFQDLPRVEVSSVEATLGAPSRTLRTVERLSELHPGATFRLVVGADVLVDSDKWHAFDEIVSRAPLFVLGRAGVPHPDAPPAVLPDVSSTRVREALSRRTTDEGAAEDLRRWVPRAVLRYIDAQGLYP